MSTQDLVLLIVAAFGPIRSYEIYRSTGRNDATVSRAIACLKKSGEIAPLQLTNGDPARVGRWWVTP